MLVMTDPVAVIHGTSRRSVLNSTIAACHSKFFSLQLGENRYGTRVLLAPRHRQHPRDRVLTIPEPARTNTGARLLCGAALNQVSTKEKGLWDLPISRVDGTNLQVRKR